MIEFRKMGANSSQAGARLHRSWQRFIRLRANGRYRIATAYGAPLADQDGAEGSLDRPVEQK